MIDLRCHFCDASVSRMTAYRRVAGWEHPRRAGGANQITLRETLPMFACPSCIDRLKRGVAIDQGSLL